MKIRMCLFSLFLVSLCGCAMRSVKAEDVEESYNQDDIAIEKEEEKILNYMNPLEYIEKNDITFNHSGTAYLDTVEWLVKDSDKLAVASSVTNSVYFNFKGTDTGFTAEFNVDLEVDRGYKTTDLNFCFFDGYTGEGCIINPDEQIYLRDCNVTVSCSRYGTETGYCIVLDCKAPDDFDGACFCVFGSDMNTSEEKGYDYRWNTQLTADIVSMFDSEYIDIAYFFEGEG